MSSPGYHLHLRLFLEGLEIPVIGASVMTQIGSAATATIQVVPDDTLLELLPRTVVHLFVLDSMEFEASEVDGAARDHHYKLLFCGEVTGVQFSKSGAGSRSASLNCIDFSNVWDTNYAFSLNFGQSDPQNATVENRSAFLAISQPSFNNIIQTPATLVRLISQQHPQTQGLQGTQSVLGGLFSVLEALSGVQGAFMGAGPWPTVQERRTRVLDSIVSDSGETAAELYSAATFSEWLKGRQGQVGAVSSFRDTINMILGFIFYDFVPNPTPKYIRGEDQSKKYPGRDIPSSAKEALREEILTKFKAKTHVQKDLRKLINLNLEFMEKVIALLTGLTTRIGEPLYGNNGEETGWKFDFRINDGWREAKEARSAHEKGFAIDIGHPGFSGRLFAGRMPFKIEDGVAQPVTEAEAVTVQGRFRHIMFEEEGKGNEIESIDALIDAAHGEDYRGLWASSDYAILEDIEVLHALSGWSQIVIEEMERLGDEDLQSGANPRQWADSDPLFRIFGVANDPVHIQDRNYRTKFASAVGTVTAPAGSQSIRERLNSFIFRPNIWFCAPPRCNVIYPDQTTSFSMQRAMLRETTRLQLNLAFDMIKEDGPQLDKLAFAPKLVGEEQNTQGGLGTAEKVIIHDHEVYSGVIPKFERASDLLYYRLKNIDGVTSSETDTKISDFADRLAHFHLLSNRYLARQASVTSVFNMNLVCGFPAVVIDAPLSSYELSQVKDGKRSERAHWLGMISSISHSITQGGGQTNVSLTHVRSHRTGDKTDDLFSENIDSSGYLTIQSRAEVLRGQGIFTLGAGAFIPVLNSYGTSVPQYLGLPLKEDPEQLYFWEALGTLIGGNLLTFANQMTNFDPSTVNLIDAGKLTDTDFGDAVAAGQEVAISEVPVPGGKTTKSVVWSGAPTTVIIRLHGTVETEFGVGQLKYVGKLEVSSAQSSSILPGDKLVELLEAKKSGLFWDDLKKPTFAEFLITLPGSTLAPSEVSADARLGLPVEEAIRPSWISADYSTELGESGLTKISERVYLPFFGSPCIVDGVLSEKPAEGLVRQSVEQAVDKLVYDYSQEVASGGRHTMRFIHGSTHRKVATLPEILQRKQVYLKSDGTWGREKKEDPALADEKYALYGGFHSNAVNFGLESYGSKLEFLDLKRPLQSRYGKGTEDLSGQITEDLDPRAERARRVVQYRGQVRAPSSLYKRPTAILSTSDESATIQTSLLGIAKRG